MRAKDDRRRMDMNPTPTEPKITDFDLEQLATLLADNVQDSGPKAFDSPEQAVRLHEDEMSECAVDRHGRRLTRVEWLAVSSKALVMVSYQFDLWRRADDHGLCGCVDCHKAGKPTPARPWVVTRVEAATTYGLRVQGVNLYSAPSEYGREFSWSFARAHDAFKDTRYDATNAEITPEALALMERASVAQPVLVDERGRDKEKTSS